MFNENFFEDIINSIEPCICIYNREGVIIYFNKPFRDCYLEDNKTFEDLTFDDINSEEYKSISYIKEVLEEESVVSRQKQYGSEGGFQITTSPFDGPEQQSLIIETIIRPYKNTSDNIDLSPNRAILEDEAMKNILEAIFRISNFDSTILISGESGTGKSMLANFIHKNSKRAKEPFVTINCATIPENLIESELFGYVSGAFTGANQKGKKGRVELANKGTLFLDEIGLLPIHLQSKFLQLIQEKTYMPVGAIKSRKVDIRIISATNLNLKKQITENKFREDLFYRLRVIEFNIPPLRERIDAIEPLIDHFINHFNNKYQIKKTISAQAKEILKEHSWPGNIRELQYIIERLIVTSPDDVISIGDIPSFSEPASLHSGDADGNRIDFDKEIKQFEKKLLQNVSINYKSSYKLAEALGITQTRASRLLRKHGIKLK